MWLRETGTWKGDLEVIVDAFLKEINFWFYTRNSESAVTVSHSESELRRVESAQQ